MKYVRVVQNFAVEILEPQVGFQITDCFHPDLIAMCEQVSTPVEAGWERQEDGTFAAPAETLPAEVTEEPVTEEPAVETPAETPAEPA